MTTAGTGPRGEQPLAGRRVVVTRAADQSAALVAALGEMGAEVICLPTIATETVVPGDMAMLLNRLGSYDWIFVTSENGVRHLLAVLASVGHDPSPLSRARFAAVGRGTATALGRAGLDVAFVPAVAAGKAMLREFEAGWDVRGLRVLRVRGDLAGPELERGLRAAGAQVDIATVYLTRPATPDPDLVNRIRQGTLAAVTFASGSSVESFAKMFTNNMLYVSTPAVCIGQVTAAAARRAGWRRVVVAGHASTLALARAVVDAVSWS